jgi:aspartate 1-decarboxylase
VNGSAAHKAHPKDIIIIAAYANYSEMELQTFRPKLIYVDERNGIVDQRHQIPAQAA